MLKTVLLGSDSRLQSIYDVNIEEREKCFGSELLESFHLSGILVDQSDPNYHNDVYT